MCLKELGKCESPDKMVIKITKSNNIYLAKIILPFTPKPQHPRI